MKTINEVVMRKPRKKISKMGWGVRWPSGKVDFYRTERCAQYELDYLNLPSGIIFRCKIEEVTK